MRRYLFALLLSACSAPYEGDRVKVAGVEFEGMAWRVDCEKDTPESLYERWIDESPNYCDAELAEQYIKSYDMCPSWYVIKFRYEWAKKEWREKCAL